MSINKYTTAQGLVTLANGSRMWVGTKAAYEAARQAGTMPTDVLVAIIDDEQTPNVSYKEIVKKTGSSSITYSQLLNSLWADTPDEYKNEGAINTIIRFSNGWTYTLMFSESVRSIYFTVDVPTATTSYWIRGYRVEIKSSGSVYSMSDNNSYTDMSSQTTQGLSVSLLALGTE